MSPVHIASAAAQSVPDGPRLMVMSSSPEGCDGDVPEVVLASDDAPGLGDGTVGDGEGVVAQHLVAGGHLLVELQPEGELGVCPSWEEGICWNSAVRVEVSTVEPVGAFTVAVSVLTRFLVS